MGLIARYDRSKLSRSIATAVRLLCVLLFFNAAFVLQAGATETGVATRDECGVGANPQPLVTVSGDSETPQFNSHREDYPYNVSKDSSVRMYEKFQKLHQERLGVIQEIEHLTAVQAKFLSKPPQIPIPVPCMTDDMYNARVALIEAEVRKYETIQNNRDVAESEHAEAHARLLDLTRQKARSAMELGASKEYENAWKEYLKAVQESNAVDSRLSWIKVYAAKVDDAIGDIIISNDSEASFRLNMGVAFVILVGILIVCFFSFGWKSNSLQNIFKDDRGLQFIALFSLIIAITMFGLLNILEGKELSALLGGLSGYILGRTNIGERYESRDGPNR